MQRASSCPRPTKLHVTESSDPSGFDLWEEALSDCFVMADDQTTLKDKIRSGAPLLGAVVPVFSDRLRLSQIVDRHRYDWFHVDAQHVAFDEVWLRDFCGVASELSTPVMLRIKHTRHTYLIGNLLDLGPVGVEVPQVELESTVDEAVANSYYPPDGVRSWGGQDRYGFSGQPLDEYIDLWHRTGVLAIQLESITAATGARHLVRPGVDFVTFGPSDLTLNIRNYPSHTLKTVEDCVAYVTTDLQGTGVRSCMRVPAGADTSSFRDMGVSMFLENQIP